MEEEKSFFERMFDNIGDKIKILSKILCWIGIIASIIVAIIMFVEASDYYNDEEGLIISGWLYLTIGPLATLFSSWFVYGFGELIVMVSNLEKRFCSKVDSFVYDDKQDKINDKQKVYICTTCGEKIYFGDTNCKKCGQKFDWSNS